MKSLLAIPHFFRPEQNPVYSSTDPARREQRAEALKIVIDSWRGHLGPASSSNLSLRKFDQHRGMEDTLDIAIMVSGKDHLLDGDFCAKHGAHIIDTNIDDPRKLGFLVHKLFLDNRKSFDMYIYSEDDLKIPDGGILSRSIGFQETFGYRRVLLPNRYEWNQEGPSLKTFIDGEIPRQLTESYLATLPDEDFLQLKMPGRNISFRRAVNPHSGFFCLTAEQLDYWAYQPHFLDMDCSFISPLESAASLGLMKTFSVYKSFGRDAGWHEIQHLDTKFSSPSWPV